MSWLVLAAAPENFVEDRRPEQCWCVLRVTWIAGPPWQWESCRLPANGEDGLCVVCRGHGPDHHGAVLIPVGLPHVLQSERRAP